MGVEASDGRTRSQRMASKAFERVQERQGNGFEEYKRFVKSFPTLIHTSGLAQALAYATSKHDAGKAAVEDLAKILDHNKADLEHEALEADATAYLRLSRQALEASGWLKRFAEAPPPGGDGP